MIGVYIIITGVREEGLGVRGQGREVEGRGRGFRVQVLRNRHFYQEGLR
jgi:hypothetical protein